MSPAKPGNAEYLVLAGFPYPFVDLESAYKPRTLSLVGEGMVSTAKTNWQNTNNIWKIILILKTQQWMKKNQSTHDTFWTYQILGQIVYDLWRFGFAMLLVFSAGHANILIKVRSVSK